jgi:hypothetical protein
MLAFAQQIVELPMSLQAALLAIVFIGVRALLGRWLPEEKLSEVAAGLTSVLLTVIGAFLGLIPVEFESVASTLLTLAAILVGMVFAVRQFMRQRRALFG